MTLQITEEDFLSFMDNAFDSMLGIVENLGDERANTRPDLPGANSPYAILYHCVAVIDFWVGSVLGGRNIPREHRDAEFDATGMAEEVRLLVDAVKGRMREDIKQVNGDQPVAHTPNVGFSPPVDYSSQTQGHVLIHAYEELAQHLGQMELTRDIIVKAMP